MPGESQEDQNNTLEIDGAQPTDSRAAARSFPHSLPRGTERGQLFFTRGVVFRTCQEIPILVPHFLWKLGFCKSLALWGRVDGHQDHLPVSMLPGPHTSPQGSPRPGLTLQRWTTSHKMLSPVGIVRAGREVEKRQFCLERGVQPVLETLRFTWQSSNQCFILSSLCL